MVGRVVIFYKINLFFFGKNDFSFLKLSPTTTNVKTYFIKGVHAIRALVLVLRRTGEFIYVNAGVGCGSVQADEVLMLKTSGLVHYLEETNSLATLMYDAACKNLVGKAQWLSTPLTNAEKMTAIDNFPQCTDLISKLATERSVIERVFGIQKRIFGILASRFRGRGHAVPRFAKTYILTCQIMNLLLRTGEKEAIFGKTLL